MSTDIPHVPLLDDKPRPQVADALLHRKESILERWESAVREALPHAESMSFAQLRDHLPLLLDRLGDALRTPGTMETFALKESTRTHSNERFVHQYSLRELLTEYRLLRRIVIEEVAADIAGPLTTAELVALDLGIDAALQEGVNYLAELQREQLRSATEAEAKYLAFLSHDLRNHLNHALLVLEVHSQRLRSESPVHHDVDDLDSIRRSILETMDGMNRLLAAERLRNAMVAPKRESFDMRKLVESLLARFRPEAKSKGLELFSEVSPDSSITGDRELTSLVLQNLLGNAIKYSDHGAVRLLATRRPDAEWTIAVTDDGPGIAEEDRDRLFGAFVRGNTHGQPGAGLGLSIASQAAQLLGGTLSIHSILGVGSTFTLTLPHRSRAPDPGKIDGPSAPPANPLRILLVEDIPETARIMVRLLNSMGHATVAVSSVDAALRAAADQPFDAVVSDIGLQGKSGLDLMRELRTLHPTLPGIALTGSGTGADERRSSAAGFSHHLTKPVDAQALASALKNLP